MELFTRFVARIKAAVAIYVRYANGNQSSAYFRYGELNSGIASDLRRRFPDA